MAKYTFFWRNGKRKVLSGSNAADALNKAGYGGGAIAALDFHAKGDNQDYQWDGQTWTKKESKV